MSFQMCYMRLPLWYAKRLARVEIKLLKGYRNAMNQTLCEQSVDRAWREGVQDLAEEEPESEGEVR